VIVLIERNDRLVDNSVAPVMQSPMSMRTETLAGPSNAGIGILTDWSFARANGDGSPVVIDAFGFTAAGAPDSVADTACMVLGLEPTAGEEAETFTCAPADLHSPLVRADVSPDPVTDGYSRVVVQFAD